MTPSRFKLVSAVHLYLLREDRILLLRRYNTGYEDGKLSVIAGHLDGGEQVKDAMRREAQEEVGVELTSEELAVVGVMHRLTTDERIDWFLAANRWKGEPVNREPHRCSELMWSPLANLPTEMVPYVRRSIENYLDGRWFDSYGWD
jgi:8-oxo-dGTP pyrophosphatase MutT (NUDIX family)